MAKLISKRYAKALFDLAVDSNKIDELQNESQFVLNCLKNEHEFLKVFNHPQISNEEKFSMFEKIFKDNVSNEILGLVKIMTSKNRSENLIQTLNLFLELIDEHNGLTTALVSSPKDLSYEQLENLKQSLSKNLNKKIIIKTEIKPELIGGLKIQVCGKIIDNSIKKQLDDIKKSLLANK